MAVSTRLACQAARQALLHCRSLISVQPVRYRYKRIRRGKWPEEARTLQQRLDALNQKDPELDRMVNIGFPLLDKAETNTSEDKRLQHWSKNRHKLEYAARHRELKLDLKEVKTKWQAEQGPYHVRTIADHYGIFNDLFGTGFFYNTTPMHIAFDYDEEFVTPVYFGNRIPPSEAALAPFVEYESDPDKLWTLIMTSPDGNLQHNDRECLHWFIGNIPGSEVEKGETVCDYLQPFPVRGVGFLRYVFLLFQQSRRIDFSQQKRPENCKSLQERTFSSLEFYRQHQDDMTPASLCFFQSQWDISVSSFFHNVLDVREPAFEFIHPPNYHPKQQRYPHKQPFNLYLDRYRDVRDIQEEVLKERLKMVDPLTPPPPPPKYPNLHKYQGYVPSWLKTRNKNMRLGKHQWRLLRPET